MSIIRDFVTKLPAACGVPEGLAEIYGELNGKLFDFELANPDGPLNRKHFRSSIDRLEIGFHWYGYFGNEAVTEYALDLLVFLSKTIDADGSDWKGREASKNELQIREAQPGNSDVAALLTVDQASTLGNWA